MQNRIVFHLKIREPDFLPPLKHFSHSVQGLVEDQGPKFWYKGPSDHKIKPWNHEFEKNSKMLLNIIRVCYVHSMLSSPLLLGPSELEN